MKWLCLTLGGIAGTFARYVLAGLVYEITGTSFPYGTLIVNLTGCLIIGFLAALSEEKFLLGPNARFLLMVGFCGAFTTFSTFILETSHLIKDGENLRALWNVFSSIMIGFFIFRLGFFIGEVV
ncbi:MAG: fluoride efflux transporter CrcB [Chlamydiae bacterium]|nr:fluoride efflux transporter CrcB [Chlamydiota bacterium]MBI3266261.1 fluoride efflux transporter CrcB [Chlamydiota bacterium]